MGFEIDTGVTRASRGQFNRSKAEELLKDARQWLNKNKGKTPRMAFGEVLGRLCPKEKGKIVPLFSCANDLSWEFNPRNLRGVFRDLSVKYKIKVGSHHGTKETSKTAKKPQENYFREMLVTDIPEVDTKLREEFKSSPAKAK